MPYVKDETLVIVHRHLKNEALERIGLLVGQSLGRNKDHADKYVFTLPAGKSPQPLLAYLRIINAPHSIESGQMWAGVNDAAGPNLAAEPAGAQNAPVVPNGQKVAGQLRNSIIEILGANGESFLADRGVDEQVCGQVADEILEHLQSQTVRVLVAVRGGCVQGALADLSNIALEIHDFDVFESQPKDDQSRTKKQAERDWDMAQSQMHAIY